MKAPPCPRWVVWLLTPSAAAAAVAAGVHEAAERRTYERDLRAAEKANDESDAEFARLSALAEAKQAVVAEYVERRITLPDAARRFLSRSAGDEPALDRLRRKWPAAADDESRCAAAVVLYLGNGVEGDEAARHAHQRAVGEFARVYGGTASDHAGH